MNLSVGMVGLPNAGKSTLFNALLKKQVANVANYPFTTIEPNVGVVEMPDERLEKLKEVVEKSEGLSPTFRIVPAVVRFVDIAGLVKGAHKGEGLGNQFLSHIREVDVIVFVLRDFKNPDIIKTGETPRDDLEVLKEELLLKDLETVEKRIESLTRELKTATPMDPKRKVLETLDKAKKLVEQGKWISEELSGDLLEKIDDLQLLSAKKTIVVLNCDESSVAKTKEDQEDLSSKENPFEKDSPLKDAIRICAKLEEELAGLLAGEQKQYLGELGVSESGLEKLIKKAYETLGLSTFLTAGPKEVRACTIKKGTLAPEAAGVIHTDFERGFIAADVVSYNKFIDAGGWQAAKLCGVVKTIGKREVMEDGYVVEFKFSI